LDGGQHASQTESDKRRTLFLKKDGYQVLRFWNHEMLQNITPVLEKIFEAKQSAPHPTLSPHAGRGKNEGTLRQAQGKRGKRTSEVNGRKEMLRANGKK
jgi:hypothetical protein